MNFFIVDDSIAVRAMLTEIIHSEGLGKVVGEATDGIEVSPDLLIEKEIDFLLIDLLMNQRDGLETIRLISPDYKGKIILISQVEQKDTVAEAYLLGIDHYITKPINKYEVITVIKNEIRHYLQEKSIENIQKSLNYLVNPNFEINNKSVANLKTQSISKAETKKETCSSEVIDRATAILMELGIIGEAGCHDLLNIIEHLNEIENNNADTFQFPTMKELFEQVALSNCKLNKNDECSIKKEAKAAEQRVRRAIHRVLDNLASIGLTDYGNPIFEHYSSKFFDFTQVRMKMLDLDGKKASSTSCRLNIKKFIEVLYMEAKESI